MAGVSPLMIAGMGAGLASGASAITQAAPTNNAALYAYQNRVNELNAKQAAEERKRKAALARSSAQQRARYAAQGISPADGSSAAVLEGMKTMSEAEAADRARQVDIARNRAALSYATAAGTDLLAKKSSSYQDNLGKLMTWE